MVKVVDARSSAPVTVRRQAGLARDLGAIDPRVVAPLPIGDELVSVVGHHLVTVLPLVKGRVPDLDDPEDAQWLGQQLGRLHASLRQVWSDLPPVASLRIGEHDFLDGDVQIIHGDPGVANFLRDGDDAHVLDLGEAGLGTPGYDVALALFSRRFDVWSRAPGARTPTDNAPDALVAGYEDAVGHPLKPSELADGERVRREALAWWIEHPDQAPVGIRSATPAWREHLARFVRDDRLRS